MPGRPETGWRAYGHRTKVALWRHHPRRDVTASALHTILHRPVATVSDWARVEQAAAAAPWHPRERAVREATADVAATRTRPVPLLTRLAAAIDETDRRVMLAAVGLGFNMRHLHEADAAGWWPLPAVGLDHRLIGRGGRDLTAVVDRLRAGPGAGGMILASARVLPLSVDLRAAARMIRQLRRVAT